MIEKYLPVGTVVLLKDAKKRIVITGFAVKSDEYEGKIFDYSACFYPEGIVSAKETIIFNHDQIDKIYFIGYIDDEEKEFKRGLKAAIENEITIPEKKDEIEKDNGIETLED